jgi:hypothetical protein
MKEQSATAERPQPPGREDTFQPSQRSMARRRPIKPAGAGSGGITPRITGEPSRLMMRGPLAASPVEPLVRPAQRDRTKLPMSRPVAFSRSNAADNRRARNVDDNSHAELRVRLSRLLDRPFIPRFNQRDPLTSPYACSVSLPFNLRASNAADNRRARMFDDERPAGCESG